MYRSSAASVEAAELEHTLSLPPSLSLSLPLSLPPSLAYPLAASQPYRAPVSTTGLLGFVVLVASRLRPNTLVA